MHPLGLVVIAGGRGRRAGGADKCLLRLHGRPLLAHVLDGAPVAVVVGPERAGFPGVSWVREAPPGSGPLAGVAAGVAALPAAVELVLVVGGDMPYATRAQTGLVDALSDHDVAAVVDTAGRAQPLLALWRRPALEARLATLATLEPLADRPVRLLLDDVGTVLVPDLWGSAADVDTLADLERIARA